MTHNRSPLRFALFTANSPGGPPGTMWTHPLARPHDYRSVGSWLRLAEQLEAARFDAIFWADHSGVYDTYQGSRDASVRHSVQFPINDPSMLVPAMATVTRHLGFAFSANVVQEPPANFARRMSTLDHLTEGRIAWNIVTSFQQTAWRKAGFNDLPDHAERYARAEEYVQIVYALLEGSWEEGSVVRDVESGVYADPSRVHDVEHDGRFYRVAGPHSCEPSPQRLPVLFQAGTSNDGRAFSARNAEAMFIAAQSPSGAAKVVKDMCERLVANGREPSDVLFFQHVNCIVGETESQARAREAELAEHSNTEALLAYASATLGLDLGTIDLDTPVRDLETNAMQGKVRALAEAAPDKEWTFRDVAMSMTSRRFVGTGAQFADHVEEWAEAGVDGINVSFVTGMGEIDAFVANAVPELQRRGLMQTEYRAGTLREKLFDRPGRPLVDERHAGARARRQRA